MQTADLLQRHFSEIGARLDVQPVRPVSRGRISDHSLRLNVRTDRHGELFTMRLHSDVQVQVVNKQPADRHLLLHAVNPQGEASRFLCGHDERHWFVAAVPEDVPGVVDVRTAKLALQPSNIAAAASRLRPKARLRRRNPVYLRQGEWYFTPAPDLVPDELVLRNEPLTRGPGTKPHVMEFAYRRGGQSVYVSGGTMISEDEWLALPDDVRRRRSWQHRRRDAEVFAKGRIRHADHATIVLACWHRVEMNTEQRARVSAGQIAFLD